MRLVVATPGLERSGRGLTAAAMLGALVMQSLQSGMVLVGIDTPFQRIVVGMVLVVAVWLDYLCGDEDQP